MSELTKETYITDHSFMSFTRYSKFMSCEASAAAHYKTATTPAMLMSSYVDAYFSNELKEFKEQHLEIFTKTGTLKSDYVKAEEIIKRIESDENLMYYLSGEKQKIMAGVIDGVKFKAKMDSYKEHEFIVDLKVMKDFKPIWSNGMKSNFIDAYMYTTELALFQEIVYQNTGEKLPCYIAGITKETPSDVGIFEIPQVQLDLALSNVKEHLTRINSILKGEVAPNRCGECEYCRLTKKAEVMNYYFAGMNGNQLREEGIECCDPKVKQKNAEGDNK